MYSRKTQKELLKEQFKITGQIDDFKEIVKSGFVEDALIDDSFANVLRLMLFGSGADEEEDLMVILSFTREKLRRIMK